MYEQQKELERNVRADKRIRTFKRIAISANLLYPWLMLLIVLHFHWNALPVATRWAMVGLQCTSGLMLFAIVAAAWDLHKKVPGVNRYL